jgi:hypothetical protein
MTTAKWTNNPDSTATWIQFGPYQLQGVRADCKDDMDPIHAAIQIIDDLGATVAEEELTGDPDILFLRLRALAFAQEWLRKLTEALYAIPAG